MDSKKSYHHELDPRCPILMDSLADIYKRQAERDTGKGVTWWRPALRMTYKEIYYEAMELSKGLIALGLKSGDCVAAINTESADNLLMFVATSMIGLIFTTDFVEGNPPNAKELVYCRDPKMIVIGSALGMGTDDEPVYATEYLCAEIGSRFKHDRSYQIPHLFYDREAVLDHKCKQQNLIDLECEIAINSLESLKQMGRWVSDEELSTVIDSVPYNVPCLYSSTSGSTTGKGKIVVVGASQFVNAGRRKQLRLNMNEQTVFGICNPYSDEIGLYDEFCSSVFTGREIVVLPAPRQNDHENCTEILQCIEKTKCDMVYCDNYYFGYIMANDDLRHSFNLECFSSFIIGGSGTSATFKQKLLKEFPNTIDSYGLSENFYVTAPVPGTQSERIDSVGRPLPNDEVKVVNQEGYLVDRNSPGELWIRSYANFLEYKGDPEMTKKALTDDGWFKTGDCVTMDNGGHINILGRFSKTEMCIVAGQNIFPQPIERAMMAHKHISGITIVGVNTGTAVGDELCYCIVPERGSELTIESINIFAKAQVAGFLDRPTRVFFYDGFPRKASRNKTDRQRLREQCTEKIANDRFCDLCDREQYVKLYGSSD